MGLDQHYPRLAPPVIALGSCQPHGLETSQTTGTSVCCSLRASTGQEHFGTAALDVWLLRFRT